MADETPKTPEVTGSKEVGLLMQAVPGLIKDSPIIAGFFVLLYLLYTLVTTGVTIKIHPDSCKSFTQISQPSKVATVKE